MECVVPGVSGNKESNPIRSCLASRPPVKGEWGWGTQSSLYAGVLMKGAGAVKAEGRFYPDFLTASLGGGTKSEMGNKEITGG